MRDFEILFDQAEPSPVSHPAYRRYGNLGFPTPHAERPWTFANFVQSIDGIASFRGKHATGGDIARSPEDKWLMHLLRAHADAIIMGIGTLLEETRGLAALNQGRGPVYRVEEPEVQELRRKLGRTSEKVVFVTASASLDPSLFRIFDVGPDAGGVDAYILTNASGAARLQSRRLKVLVAGEAGGPVDLAKALTLLRAELGVEYLLCEGGPTLYGNMSRAGLVDEKFLTISPLEIGLKIPPEQEPAEREMSDPPRERPTTFTAPGLTFETAPWWRWMSCRRVGDHEFNRYRRKS
jgi:riboflavin biosynthesis pyrimidine reductase